ncbi:interleukin 15, like [Betta splendens]|uniref:Interleukin n=1 Tax=Betta splendens TaxID=158456 RepID=A0A9W2Y853_BETSP|nr:interleukin 15, like [Betta splendens]
MLRGGAALATVFLCSVLVLTKKDPERCGQDVIIRVRDLIQKAPKLKWLDTRLYTPSTADSQPNCIASNLNCFAAEANVLHKEWEKVGEEMQDELEKMLQTLATSVNKIVSPDSTCLQCELLQEKNAETFLSELLSTLQSVQSRFCH